MMSKNEDVGACETCIRIENIKSARNKRRLSEIQSLMKSRNKRTWSDRNTNDSGSAIGPLYEALMPRKLDDFVGQSNVVGPKTTLFRMLRNNLIPSIFMFGSEGSGKSSLINIVTQICMNDAEKYESFHRFEPEDIGAEELKIIHNHHRRMEDRKNVRPKPVVVIDNFDNVSDEKRTVIFDCLHNGEIVLICAAERLFPIQHSHMYNRFRVVKFEPLTSNDMREILTRAGKSFGLNILKRGDSHEYSEEERSMSACALDSLISHCKGNARMALNRLKTIHNCLCREGKFITAADVQKTEPENCGNHDLLRSLQLSIVADNDPNSTIYWLTRLIEAREDPQFIARRLVRMAVEDVGEADPNALQLAVATLQGCVALGNPESDLLLAQCAVHLAKAPKSRKIDLALNRAKSYVIRDSLRTDRIPQDSSQIAWRVRDVKFYE